MKKIAILLMVAMLLVSQMAFAAPKKIPLLKEDEIPSIPKGVHNYLLFCTDAWDGNPENIGNTDGILLVTVDEYANRVMLTSFLRDTLIVTENGEFSRLSRYVTNNGRNQKAVEKFVGLMGAHFGVKIDKYMLVDWGMVIEVIEAVGGVTVELTASEIDYLSGLGSFRRDWGTPPIYRPGIYTLRGYGALQYMRCRKGTTSTGENYDFGRTARARMVINNVAKSLENITFEQAMGLLNVVVENTVMTNMSMMDMVQAVTLAYNLRTVDIEQLRIPIDGTYENYNLAGGSAVQIEYPVNREAIWDFIYDDSVQR